MILAKTLTGLPLSDLKMAFKLYLDETNQTFRYDEQREQWETFWGILQKRISAREEVLERMGISK